MASVLSKEGGRSFCQLRDPSILIRISYSVFGTVWPFGVDDGGLLFLPSTEGGGLVVLASHDEGRL